MLLGCVLLKDAKDGLEWKSGNRGCAPEHLLRH